MTTALRAESIVNVHVQHARDCARDCQGTFACSSCKHRCGDCCRDFFMPTLCTRCRRKQLAADAERV